VVEVVTDAGIVGIGETRGGESKTAELQKARGRVIGKSPFAYRSFAAALSDLDNAVYAGIELACLDAIGRATGLRLCELLGGPVRERVEFSAYLFYRYAADDPRILDDARIVDGRGRGDRALDQVGEVRTPKAMAELAWKFHERYGFRVHKLKAGVLPPDVELETLHAMNDRFGGKHSLRIDPNSRWSMRTALRIGEKLKALPLEYYEDPVRSQRDMAEVRRKTGLVMSTNTCVTRLEHIPEAVETKPVDVVLCDHHGWGGITACQALGQMADVLDWRLSQHSNNHAGITMAAMIHVGAVVPQLTLAGDTHYVQLIDGADIIVGDKLPIKDGFMAVPRAPGVGVELDRDKLARAHEVYEKCGMRERDDAGSMRRVEPGWERNEW
jgi:glucarate dehydratase